MSHFYAELHNSSKNSHKFYELVHEAGSKIVIAEYGRLPGFGRPGTRSRYVYECFGPLTASRKFQ